MTPCWRLRGRRELEAGAMAPRLRRRLEGSAAHHGDESPESGWSVLLERHFHLAPGLLAPEAAAHWELGDQHGKEDQDHGAGSPSQQRPPVGTRRAVGPRQDIGAVVSHWPVHVPHLFSQSDANRMPRDEGRKRRMLATLLGLRRANPRYGDAAPPQGEDAAPQPPAPGRRPGKVLRDCSPEVLLRALCFESEG